jgi:competence protein ComGC
MEQQFITENEKAKLTEFRQREEQIVIGLGQIEYQIQSLELDKDSLTEQLSQLRKDQYALGQQMTETYGDGNVDLNTGEFTKA